MSKTKTERVDPHSPASLEAFLEQVAAQCREEITTGGEPVPKAYVVLSSGGLDLFLCPAANIAEKRVLQRLIKQRCMQMGVGALVVVHDSWHVRAKKGSPEAAEVERLGNLEHHSQRCEAVMATVCTPRGYYWRAWPYTRTPEGIVWDEPERYDAASGVRQHGNEWDPWGELRRAGSCN